MVKYSPQLNATFGALADPTRRGILEQLAEGRSRVTDLAEPYDISLPAVSKHLRVLEDAGLVVRTKVGREHRIGIDPRPLRAVQDWIAVYAEVWEYQFDRLDEYLARVQVSSGESGSRPGPREEPFGTDSPHDPEEDA